MKEHWWNLPGPSRFVDRVERDVRDGHSVFLELPLERPSGLREAVAERFSESSLHWEDLFASDDKPLDLMYDLFLPDHPPSALRTMESLPTGDRFSMLIVWVEEIAEGDAPAWADFFEKYGTLCRSNPDWHHPVFLVPDAAAWGAHRKMKNTPYASTVRWNDTVERLDMQMYIGSLQLAYGESKLEQQVARHLMAELSLWDRDLALFLAGRSEQELFHPERALVEYAGERGWQPRAVDLELAWSKGMAFRVEERLEWHSAWLAMNGDLAQLRRRMWAAQVAVLFPHLELLRHKLLELIGPQIALPVYDEKGYAVNDLFELEFRHIYYFLSRGGAHHPPQLVSYVNELRRIRNWLAHLNVLGAENIRTLANPPRMIAELEEFAS
ncbi:hypothetical protein FE782_01760 [Paenibacillus antri]|uniref:Uncharacterized protein n=1 Tax=Paenibacillus antri TaxID=2582848 RepID=A0A5R9GPB6_9BACL|nr:hypothetical protein [Paenibacillus antri]TLS54095.1 hypothetical protein FE782_01760 [Paenibacillus antri]